MRSADMTNGNGVAANAICADNILSGQIPHLSMSHKNRERSMFSALEYRVYFMSGEAVLSRDLQCADDDAATEQAGRLFPEGIVEVWQGNRLVTRIENVAVAE